MKNNAMALCILMLGALTLGRMTSPPLKAADGQHGEPGSVVAVGYEPDTQDKAFRSGIGSIADATSIATLTSTTTGEATIIGKQNVSCEGVFTSAGQTAVVDILLMRRDAGGTIRHTWWGGPRTLTASAQIGNGNTGFATDPGAIWDTAGATNCRLVIITPQAAGTLSLWLGSY